MKFFKYYGYDFSGTKGRDVCINFKMIEEFIWENGKYFPIINGRKIEYGLSSLDFDKFCNKYIEFLDFDKFCNKYIEFLDA